MRCTITLVLSSIVFTRGEKVFVSLSESGPHSVDLSIIIPVYNALPYFHRCIDSIVEQDCGRYTVEVLLVDDGSTDGSTDYCDALAAEHDHIRVFHEANSGTPARPRNIGIDNARGEYVYFCDADDYFETDAFVPMLDHAYADGCDVGLFRVQGHGREIKAEVFAKTQRNCDVVTSAVLETLSPFKLFQRDLLLTHAIKFPEGMAYEDLPFVLESYMNAKNICVYCDKIYYHWVYRDDGSSLVQEGGTARVWGKMEARLAGLENLIAVCKQYGMPSEAPYLYKRAMDGPVKTISSKAVGLNATERDEIFRRLKTDLEPLFCQSVREIISLRSLIFLDALFTVPYEDCLAILSTWPDGPDIDFHPTDDENIEYLIRSETGDRVLLQAAIPLCVNQVNQPLQNPDIFRNLINGLQTTDSAIEISGHAKLLHRYQGEQPEINVRATRERSDYVVCSTPVRCEHFAATCAYASVFSIEFDWSASIPFEELVPAEHRPKEQVYFFLDVLFQEGARSTNRFGHNRVPGIFKDFISRAVWNQGYLFAPTETDFRNLSCSVIPESDPLVGASHVGFIERDGAEFMRVRGAINFDNYPQTDIALVFLNKHGKDVYHLPLKKGKRRGDREFRGRIETADLEQKLRTGTYTLELQVSIANKVLNSRVIKKPKNGEMSYTSEKHTHTLAKTSAGMSYSLK